MEPDSSEQQPNQTTDTRAQFEALRKRALGVLLESIESGAGSMSAVDKFDVYMRVLRDSPSVEIAQKAYEVAESIEDPTEKQGALSEFVSEVSYIAIS